MSDFQSEAYKAQRRYKKLLIDSYPTIEVKITKAKTRLIKAISKDSIEQIEKSFLQLKEFTALKEDYQFYKQRGWL
jgi:hypothetical protein